MSAPKPSGPEGFRASGAPGSSSGSHGVAGGPSDAPLGLIAGSGIFPLLFAESARRAGRRVVAVAHRGETDPALEAACDAFTWVHLGQLGKMVRAFRSEGVEEAAMVGGIEKVRIFGGLRPDLLALKHAPKLKKWGNDDLLRTVASMFEEEGIRIVDPSGACPDLVAREGLYTKRRPSEAAAKDIELGQRVAAIVSAADVGQTVCVKGGAVVAVEAMEGTDRCIRRAGEVAGKGFVVVKIAKPGQDLRFDLPCVGPTTVQTLAEAGAAAMAFEAGKSFVLDEPAVVRAADRAGIALLGLRSAD